jgi:hypothetical protein
LRCRCLYNRFATREESPDWLTAQSGRPKMPRTYTDVEGRTEFVKNAGFSTFACTADHFCAADRRTHGRPELLTISGPISQERIASKTQHFASMLGDTFCTTGVRKAKQPRNLFKSLLSTARELLDQSGVSGDVDKYYCRWKLDSRGANSSRAVDSCKQPDRKKTFKQMITPLHDLLPR